RSFSLRDLLVMKAMLGDLEEDVEADRLAESMAPAVAAGLLAQHQAGSPADYSFTHEQVRQFALASLSQPRRRAIHAAVVQMLTENGPPSVESLPMLAHHAAAAGDTERCTRFSIGAAHAALASHAPEEVLRAVEVALPLATSPQDRVDLLSLRDDAMDLLRRPQDRLDALAAASRELGCLQIGRVRAWFIERIKVGEHIPVMARVAVGESVDDILATMPISPNIRAAREHFQRALSLFEKIGDRRGVMSTI